MQDVEPTSAIINNTQFNHPLEITPDSENACWALARCGIAWAIDCAAKRNQQRSFSHEKLDQELLKCMVRPYYIFHAKGLRHQALSTRVEEGIEIMEQLRGFTSGLAVPTFIVNAPKGGGKTPMLAEYHIDWEQISCLSEPGKRGSWNMRMTKTFNYLYAGR